MGSPRRLLIHKVPFIIVNAVKEFLKRKKTSRNINRTLTILTSFVAAFGMMGLITFGILYASSHGLLTDKGEETYEHGGRTWVIHQDELPLTVEDLTAVDYDGYIKERRSIIRHFITNLFSTFHAE